MWNPVLRSLKRRVSGCSSVSRFNRCSSVSRFNRCSSVSRFNPLFSFNSRVSDVGVSAPCYVSSFNPVLSYNSRLYGSLISTSGLNMNSFGHVYHPHSRLCGSLFSTSGLKLMNSFGHVYHPHSRHVWAAVKLAGSHRNVSAGPIPEPIEPKSDSQKTPISEPTKPTATAQVPTTQQFNDQTIEMIKRVVKDAIREAEPKAVLPIHTYAMFWSSTLLALAFFVYSCVMSDRSGASIVKEVRERADSGKLLFEKGLQGLIELNKNSGESIVHEIEKRADFGKHVLEEGLQGLIESNNVEFNAASEDRHLKQVQLLEQQVQLLEQVTMIRESNEGGWFARLGRMLG